MDNLTPQQERKLRRLQKLVEEGDLAVVEYLFELEENLEKALNKLEEVKETALPKLQDVLDQVRGKDGNDGEQGIDGEKGDKGDKGDDGKEGKQGKDGRDGRDGIDGRDGVDGLDGQDGKNGIDGKEITPEQVKEKIESLKGENRVDASAIKNLPQSVERIIEGGHGMMFPETILKAGTGISVAKDAFGKWVITSTGGAGGGHTIQDEGSSETQRTNLNFVGAGVSVADDVGNDATVVTISGATVTFVNNELVGTGDDTTTVFALDFTPSAGTVHLYAGGVRQLLTTDYSISGTSITFVIAPPNGMKIVADYQT